MDRLSVWAWLVAGVLFVLPDDATPWLRDAAEDERLWFLTAAVAGACAFVVHLVGSRFRRREAAIASPTLVTAYDVLMTALGVPVVLCLVIPPTLLFAWAVRAGIPSATSNMVWVVPCLLVLGFWCGLRGRVLGCVAVGPLAVVVCLAAVSGPLRTFAAETAADPTELILSVSSVVAGGLFGLWRSSPGREPEGVSSSQEDPP